MASLQKSALQTGVLVLGAGGAGLRAAIAARRAGADVLVASKLPREDHTCTDLAWGGATYSTAALEDELFRQVVETGGYLNNQALVEAFVREVPARVAELAELGVSMQVLDDADTEGCLGVSRVATEVSPRGTGMTRPLRQTAEALGVQFMDGLMISALLVSDGAVQGALGVTVGERPRALVLAAPAVVVATGGGARLYERTDNPAGTTGDGIVLAFEAGAELVDMELISFHFPEGRIGEAFAVAGIPAKQLSRTGAAHYFLGGIAIDEHCRTGVGGLFAAGENAGGLFGAARLGGAALGDVLVFGARAGEQAAAHAASAAAAAPDAAQVEQALHDLENLLRGLGAPAAVPTKALQRLMWECCGTIKSAASLEEALIQLGALEAAQADLAAGSPNELREALEYRNLLTIARPILQASLLRQESRGCFWRHDFPEADNERWVHNIHWRLESGVPRHEIRPATMTRLTVPTRPPLGAGCFSYLPPRSP